MKGVKTEHGHRDGDAGSEDAQAQYCISYGGPWSLEIDSTGLD